MSDGTEVAATSIMEKLKNICGMEDAGRPLSDQKIAELLRVRDKYSKADSDKVQGDYGYTFSQREEEDILR